VCGKGRIVEPKLTKEVRRIVEPKLTKEVRFKK